VTRDARTATRALLGVPAVAANPLGGNVSEVRLADGERVVAKRHDHATAVHAEVASLAWLSEPAVLPLPEVRAHDDEWVVMRHVAPGQPSPAAAEALGRGLARLHATGAPCFGAPPPGGPVDAWMGLEPMRNEPGEDWPSWFAAHRIEPYLRTAVDRGALDESAARLITTICERIESLAGPREPPARLHGDLWSGNVLWAADGRAWLIDPAAHGGHRETDLALLDVFGCPHLDRILAGYQEVAPLADGWRHRVPLHQLFLLSMHAARFGRGYAPHAVAAARAALRA
jgi:fructosamine-3-kinase